MGKAVRKIRSDKKKDVRPTIDQELYETISRISHITNTPIKNVGETFCIHGLYSRKVIEHLAEKFRRDYKFQNTIFIGDRDLHLGRTRRRGGINTRITMRFSQDAYDQLTELAFAMDTTVSTATGILLRASIYNTDIVNEYVSEHVEGLLDDNRKKQLNLVLKFLRKENPYETDDISLAQLISYVMGNFMDKSRNVKQAVEDWLDSVTKQD